MVLRTVNVDSKASNVDFEGSRASEAEKVLRAVDWDICWQVRKFVRPGSTRQPINITNEFPFDKQEDTTRAPM
jgi:hypothetical protein